jgi:hypothetical protein
MPGKESLGPAAKSAKDWIDVVSYAGGKVITGVGPLLLAGLGGVELFAPGLLPAVHMSEAMGSTLLTGAVGYLLPGFFKAAGRGR